MRCALWRKQKESPRKNHALPGWGVSFLCARVLQAPCYLLLTLDTFPRRLRSEWQGLRQLNHEAFTSTSCVLKRVFRVFYPFLARNFRHFSCVSPQKKGSTVAVFMFIIRLHRFNHDAVRRICFLLQPTSLEFTKVPKRRLLRLPAGVKHQDT